jgi:hypothetical protein
LASYIFLVFLASSIRSRCPVHLKRCSLIKVPILTSLYNLSTSTVVLSRL